MDDLAPVAVLVTEAVDEVFAGFVPELRAGGLRGVFVEAFALRGRERERVDSAVEVSAPRGIGSSSQSAQRQGMSTQRGLAGGI